MSDPKKTYLYSPQEVTSIKLQVSSYKYQVTSIKLQVSSYKCQVTSIKLQVSGYKVQKYESAKLKVLRLKFSLDD